MHKIDLTDVKPRSMSFYLCSFCAQKVEHTSHNGPMILLDGVMLDRWWEVRSEWTDVRSWYGYMTR